MQGAVSISGTSYAPIFTGQCLGSGRKQIPWRPVEIHGRLMMEIVGLQLFLTNVLSPIACGEQMSAAQYQEPMRQVKLHKHHAAREVLKQ